MSRSDPTFDVAALRQIIEKQRFGELKQFVNCVLKFHKYVWKVVDQVLFIRN